MGANQETLMYTLEKSIKKKADLFEHSFSAYAVRSILASLYLGLGIGDCHFSLYSRQTQPCRRRTREI